MSRQNYTTLFTNNDSVMTIHAFFVMVETFICITTTILNLLILKSLWKSINKNTETACTNICVLNLCVVDCLFGFLVGPMTIARFLKASFSARRCYIYDIIYNFQSYLCITSLLVIAIYKVIRLIIPFSQTKVRHILVSIIIAWLIAVIPTLTGSMKYNAKPDHIFDCTIFYTITTLEYICTKITFMSIASIIMAGCYLYCIVQYKRLLKRRDIRGSVSHLSIHKKRMDSRFSFRPFIGLSLSSITSCEDNSLLSDNNSTDEQTYVIHLNISRFLMFYVTQFPLILLQLMLTLQKAYLYEVVFYKNQYVAIFFLMILLFSHTIPLFNCILYGTSQSAARHKLSNDFSNLLRFPPRLKDVPLLRSISRYFKKKVQTCRNERLKSFHQEQPLEGDVKSIGHDVLKEHSNTIMIGSPSNSAVQFRTKPNTGACIFDETVRQITSANIMQKKTIDDEHQIESDHNMKDTGSTSPESFVSTASSIDDMHSVIKEKTRRKSKRYSEKIPFSKTMAYIRNYLEETGDMEHYIQYDSKLRILESPECNGNNVTIHKRTHSDPIFVTRYYEPYFITYSKI